MQKRRGHYSGSGLPMTEADAVKMSGGMNVILAGRTALPGKKRRKAKTSAFSGRSRRNYSRIWGLLGLLATVVTIGLYFRTSSSSLADSDVPATGGGIAGMIQRQRQRRRREKQKAATIIKPLAHFSTLQYAFQHSKLVGLYFAASWCPHSTPVTEALDKYFRDIVLPPKSDDEEAGEITQQYPLAIVHVSSDTKEDKFQDYVKPNWITVPFHSPEKTSLKRHFEVCSKLEVESLGIDRKYEIPTLLIIDSASQTVLTSHGVDDLDEFQDKALQHWTELHELVRGMEEKYTQAEEDEDGLSNEPARDRRRGMANKRTGAAAGTVGELFGPN
jgi:glutaredoxin